MNNLTWVLMLIIILQGGLLVWAYLEYNPLIIEHKLDLRNDGICGNIICSEYDGYWYEQQLNRCQCYNGDNLEYWQDMVVENE